MSLEECLTMEYRMTQACMKNEDFFEGIRALLIEKDGNPSWNPARIEDVTDELVDGYFVPVDNDLLL